MDALTGKAGEILSQSVPGYHCYRLTPRPVIRYAGANLCRMLGCTPEDLVSDKEDRYGQWVYPGDRDAYAAALDSLSRSPHSRTIQYRLVGRDGSVRYVSDTLTSRQGEDGGGFRSDGYYRPEAGKPRPAVPERHHPLRLYEIHL